MYVVLVKKIAGYEKTEDGIAMQLEPMKAKYFLNAKRSFTQFEKWSNEEFPKNKCVVERYEISLVEFFQVVLNKGKYLYPTGRSVVKQFKSGTPFHDLS